jgi:hypothetical protein
MNRIKQVIRKPLSDSDLKRYSRLRHTNINISGLSKYTELLDELLPKAYDFVIILLLEIAQSGHWCCLIRNPSHVRMVRFSMVFQWIMI